MELVGEISAEDSIPLQLNESLQPEAHVVYAHLTDHASRINIIQKGQLHTGVSKGEGYSQETTLVGVTNEVAKAVLEQQKAVSKEKNVSTHQYHLDQHSPAFPVQPGSVFFGQVNLTDHARFNSMTYVTVKQEAMMQVLWVNLPPALSQFTGRVKLLEELEAACKFEDWDPLQRRLLHIHGLAGLGKSEVALTFANCHLEKVSLAWLIRCENELLYDVDYRLLAQALRIPLDRDSTEEVVRKVHLFLENMKEEKPWLLILDNVEKRVPLPARGGVVMITSQSEKLDFENPILFRIEPFDKSETMQFLFDRGLQAHQLDEIDRLHKELGGWPLLLSQVLPYLSDTSSKVSDYLAQLQSIDPLFIHEEFDKYPRSLGQAFAMTREAIERSYPEAARLLFVCAYLDPNQIEEELFKSWYQEGHLVWSKKALHPLRNRGILRKMDQSCGFKLHKLWQAYLQRYLEGQSQAHIQFAEVVDLIEKALDEFDHHKPETWEQGRMGTFHLMKLCSFELWKNIESTKRADLLNSAGLWWLACKAIPNNAEQLLIESLEIRKAVLGDLHPDVAMSLDIVASCYATQGKYEDALNMHNKALEIRKAVLGDKDRDVALSLFNIASSKIDQEKYEDALKLYSEALEILKAILGDQHFTVAGCLDSIGLCYSAQGKYEEALKLHMEALEIRKAVLGNDHPDVAASLNNMANVYSDLGKYKEALKLYAEALEIQKAVVGDQHPKVAGILNNIANVYSDLGKYKEALKLHSEALEIRKAILGGWHLNVAESLEGMANCYSAQMKYGDALKLYVEALEILKAILGDRHPKVARSLGGIANCYYAQKKYEEALKLHAEALEIQKVVFVERHSDVAASLNNMGICCASQGKHEEALKLFAEALDIKKALFGDQHPEFATSLDNLGTCYFAQGKHEEALKLHAEALKILIAALGDRQPDVAISLNNVANCFYALGKHEEALKLKTEASLIHKEFLRDQLQNIAR